MPTPFTHLETAQRLLRDAALPVEYRTFLRAHCAAFLLGNVAADARNGARLPREATHFYAFDRPMPDHPWRVMLQTHPTLQQASTPSHCAFLAGYVAHLAVDEAWTQNMVRVRFVEHDWGAETSRHQRFFMLHILLTSMDERDLVRLEPWHAATLSAAVPTNWLPFMSDVTLAEWRDFIAGQLLPGALSQTLNVFGQRLQKTPAEMRAVLDSPEALQMHLWRYVPLEYLAEVEQVMYNFACDQLRFYLDEYLSKVQG